MKVKHPQQLRKKIVEKIQNILMQKDNNIPINLEKGIYNYSIKNATKKSIIKKWDNPFFVRMYIDRVRTVLYNIKEDRLKDVILSKKILAHEVAFMTHQEMKPEKWEQLLQQKKIKQKNRYEPEIQASTDTEKCRKCKSNKCSYYQLQTRSADEPMTTFVTCLNCGNRWKY